MSWLYSLSASTNEQEGDGLTLSIACQDVSGWDAGKKEENKNEKKKTLPTSECIFLFIKIPFIAAAEIFTRTAFGFDFF